MDESMYKGEGKMNAPESEGRVHEGGGFRGVCKEIVFWETKTLAKKKLNSL